MDKINELYNQVRNLEEVLSEYNTSKNKIKHLETDTHACEAFLEGKEKKKIELKIKDLEGELEKVEKEIKKIDLCSKDCYTLSDIKMMFKFVVEENVLLIKTISYLESLIYPVYVDSEQVKVVFKPSSYKENCILKGGVFKVLKISLEINELFELLKNRHEIFLESRELLRKILKGEMEGTIPSRISCYEDGKYLYLLFLRPVPEGTSEEEHFFKDLTFVGIDFLNNFENVIDIFYEIFKRNLCKLLLLCDVTYEDLEDTNLFLSQTEFFITNIEEWKLDCAMKEIITLSKKEKKWSTMDWLSEKAISDWANKLDDQENKQVSSLSISLDAFRNTSMLPKEISHVFFRILLCIKILLSCKSKRIEKAEKIVERAILKMFSQKTTGPLFHHFIIFSELTVLVRLFPNSTFSPAVANLREEMFFTISKISTELTRSLNDSLLLLKVYFKEKHYDFMLFVEKFVPSKSKMAFEINFFNLLYANICDHILCIKYLDNEKVADLSRLIQYVLDLSIQVPNGCIEEFKRLESFCYIFKSPIDEIMENSDSLYVSNKDLKILLCLLFKPSKEISLFLESFDGPN